jgi:hypothetical protein
VVKAIQSGALGKIAVAMLDFSSPEYDRVVINWHIIHDEASAAAFAEMLRNSPRTPGRRTSVSSALELGTLMLESSEKDILGTRLFARHGVSRHDGPLSVRRAYAPDELRVLGDKAGWPRVIIRCYPTLGRLVMTAA